MGKTTFRVLWTISGVLLLGMGVYCLFHGEVAMRSLSLLLGLFMLISGIVDLCVYFAGRRALYGAAWLLLDGLFTLLFALLLLFNQRFSMLTLPLLFGMWLLSSGASRLVNALELRALGMPGWGWFAALGALLLLAGLASLMDPWVSYATAGVTVGLALILEGISALARAGLAGRMMR